MDVQLTGFALPSGSTAVASNQNRPAREKPAQRYLHQLAAMNTAVLSSKCHIVALDAAVDQGDGATIEVVACLDVGHAEIVSSSVDLIHALEDYLQALHLHDNNLKMDQHQLPFTGSIHFAPIITALKDIGYKGWFTLEAVHYLKNMPSDQVPQAVQNLAATAKRLADMFEDA